MSQELISYDDEDQPGVAVRKIVCPGPLHKKRWARVPMNYDVKASGGICPKCVEFNAKEETKKQDARKKELFSLMDEWAKSRGLIK